MSRWEVNSRAAQQGPPLEMSEPYDGKLSPTVLRRKEGRKPLALPGPKIELKEP